jgi:hypothetical protein
VLVLLATAFKPIMSLFETPRDYAITSGDNYPQHHRQAQPKAPDAINVQYNRRIMSR